jgi:hypothetical protein
MTDRVASRGTSKWLETRVEANGTADAYAARHQPQQLSGELK